MAYMNQEKKAAIATKLKPVLKKYGVKGSLRVRNHSTIVLTIKSGKIDFISNFIQTEATPKPNMTEEQKNRLLEDRCIDVNPYWFHEHFSGTAKKFLTEAMAALKGANWYDNSDAMTDYFDTAYYVDINIGQWKKPYELTA